jgi:putative oxidoreductase
MSALAGIAWKYKTAVLSMIVGGLFIYAGAIKVSNPLALADTIAAFGILPLALINSLALALPAFEIISGVLLFAGLLRRVAALGLLISLVLYTTAIGTALARGITIDCGCFGAGGPATRGAMWWDLGRDLCLIAAAFAVYRWSMPAVATAPAESRIITGAPAARRV